MQPVQFLDGVELHRLFENGYRNLKKNMNTINDLNVFPVPDGDTGLNMVKTFSGGIAACDEDILGVDEYMQRMAHAVLLSARGNSGVIFSQFVSGLCRGFSGKEKIAFCDWAEAFGCAKEDSYKAITAPTEGTILTVIREAAKFLSENGEKYTDYKSGFVALCDNMKKTLSQTPDMLPVLKEAGVVDSGGAGLVCFVEGMCAYLCGESIEDTADFADELSQNQAAKSEFGPDSTLDYGYCTEFLLQLMHAKTDIEAFNLDAFVEPLKEMGDSIVSVKSGSIVKIHIHSFTPEKVLEYGRKFGEFVSLKIENMSVQHSEIQEDKKEREHLKYAIVAVASGQGIIDYFYSIGANAVIDGGQTNNPSVDAFLDAFESFDAEHIIVLPNNSNIILTANQAAEMYKDADVRVIPTKSVVEGYSALSMMDLWCDSVEELVGDMTAAKDGVTTGYVTTATRDTHMNGLDIKKDNFIGLDGKNILTCGSDKVSVAAELIKSITDRAEKDVIIVFCGKGAEEKDRDSLRAYLEENYPLADIGFISGEQEVYDFIISLE